MILEGKDGTRTKSVTDHKFFLATEVLSGIFGANYSLFEEEGKINLGSSSEKFSSEFGEKKGGGMRPCSCIRFWPFPEAFFLGSFRTALGRAAGWAFELWEEIYNPLVLLS
jgi:hypothetical protein